MINKDILLIKASRADNLKTVIELINQNADVTFDNSKAFRMAANNGNVSVAKELLFAGAELSANNHSALRWSSHEGHLMKVISTY